MKKIRYLIEYIFVSLLFILFEIIGYKNSSNFGAIIGKKFGPYIRSKNTIKKNLEYAGIKDENDQKNITEKMWKNYGRIFSEYPFLKKFKSKEFNNYISIEGKEYLSDIINRTKKAVFISGHFSNFELMAMQLEKSGINLAAIYRPLNNIFLNKIMERIRKKYICKNQIKKGKSGTRELLESFKKNYSVAMMLDQRVSEGIKSNFFGQPALTTTIPAQLVKKFRCKIVPVYIERINEVFFNIKICKPIFYNESASIEEITLDLNKWLEKMILANPDQWIWSHDRWK